MKILMTMMRMLEGLNCKLKLKEIEEMGMTKTSNKRKGVIQLDKTIPHQDRTAIQVILLDKTIPHQDRTAIQVIL